MSTPFFSIIIPTLNEEKNLPVILGALENQTERDFEVIVSDCHSTDKTPEIIKAFQSKIPNLQLAECEAKNVGAARNRGAAKAAGSFLICFDADVEPEPGFLAGIKEKIQKYNLDALTVWNRSKDKKFTGRFILNLMNVAMTVTQKIKPAANGPCIIVKKEIFQKIKGFDEEIVFGEDFDFIQRAHKAKSCFRFAVFTKPILYVSTRRFEKEGLFLSLQKSIKALLYQLFFGPIKKPIFNYEMGGQYYKK